MNKRSQSGQILLITLLVLSIATTVSLSLIGRTSTDVNISNQIEESSKAFSAAEAGIEEALKSGSGTSGAQVLTPGIEYSVTRIDIGGAAGTYTFPKKTTRGATEVLWLSPHNDGTGALTEDVASDFSGTFVDLCWSSESTTPALEATILYKNTAGSYVVGRGAYDPAARSNNFTSGQALGTNCGQSNFYKQTITFSSFGYNSATDVLLALRIRPLYSDTQLAVSSPGVALPKQGNVFQSSGTTATGTTRTVVVNQLYRSASSLFDYAVYSQQGSFSH